MGLASKTDRQDSACVSEAALPTFMLRTRQLGLAPNTGLPRAQQSTEGGSSKNGNVGEVLCLQHEAKPNTLGARGEGGWPGRCSLMVWGIHTNVGWGVCERACVCTREEGRHTCALLGIKSNTANLENNLAATKRF